MRDTYPIGTRSDASEQVKETRSVREIPLTPAIRQYQIINLKILHSVRLHFIN